MRQLFIASTLATITACAAPHAAILSPVTSAPVAFQAEPSAEAATIATDVTEDELPSESTIAPYALVFHQGQTWKYAVARDGLLAMSSTQQPGNAVNCHVKNVEFFCDRQISNVECDSEPVNQIIGGTYTTTPRGMWRTAWNASTEQLADNTRMFARYPESLVDGRGKPIARAFHGGWCVSQATARGEETVCVNEKQGIVGASIASAKGTLRVGDVPGVATTARVAVATAR